MYFLALTRLLEIVGEAAARVTDITRQKYTDVPWAHIVALRNRISHGYDEIDCDRIWIIVSEDLPSLIRQLEGIVSQLPGTGE